MHSEGSVGPPVQARAPEAGEAAGREFGFGRSLGDKGEGHGRRVSAVAKMLGWT